MDDAISTNTEREQPLRSTFLGAALLPTPQKLVKKIQSESFMELGDLLAGNLCYSRKKPESPPGL